MPYLGSTVVWHFGVLWDKWIGSSVLQVFFFPFFLFFLNLFFGGLICLHFWASYLENFLSFCSFFYCPPAPIFDHTLLIQILFMGFIVLLSCERSFFFVLYSNLVPPPHKKNSHPFLFFFFLFLNSTNQWHCVVKLLNWLGILDIIWVYHPIYAIK